jgi:hypothetical protein
MSEVTTVGLSNKNMLRHMVERVNASLRRRGKPTWDYDTREVTEQTDLFDFLEARYLRFIDDPQEKRLLVHLLLSGLDEQNRRSLEGQQRWQDAMSLKVRP